MKKILSAFIVVLFLAGGAAGSQYTYDGEFDPVVFFSWDYVDTKYCIEGHRHDLWNNPNKNSDVKSVEAIGEWSVKQNNWILIRYGYIKNNIEYIFDLDKQKNHYRQIKPDTLNPVKNLRLKEC